MNILRKIPAILVMVGIFALSTLPANDPLLKSLDFSDKIQHFIAYLVLGITFCVWISSRKWLAKPAFWGTLIVVLCSIFGICIEYVQSLIPGRFGNDFGDMATNFAGGFVSVFLYFFAIKAFKHRG